MHGQTTLIIQYSYWTFIYTARKFSADVYLSDIYSSAIGLIGWKGTDF